MNDGKKESLTATLSLFASLSTLICCALPALFISLGLGAVVAGVVANVPGFIWLSQHKILVFVVAGILLFLSAYVQFVVPQSCPTDPQQARACARLKKISAVIFWASVIFYLLGFFFAFLIKFFI